MLQDGDKSIDSYSDETTYVPEVLAVSVKLPDFILKNPRLWLLQADAQFKLSGIIKEETQYYHILSRLPPNIIEECQDVIPDSYIPGTLKRLKSALLTRYTLSTEQRIKEVLDNIQFSPPELPSAFFRRLWATANGVLPYDVVIQRFRERLPTNISNTIAPLTNKLCTLYKTNNMRPISEENITLDVADTIQPSVNVSAIGNNNNHFRRHQQHSKSTKRPRSQTRGRSPAPRSNYREDGAWCRNHYLYRAQAKRCGRPGNCSFRPHRQDSSSNNPKN